MSVLKQRPKGTVGQMKGTVGQMLSLLAALFLMGLLIGAALERGLVCKP